MATERQAKQAVTKHARALLKLGVHSLGTTDLKKLGLTGHGVVANVAPGFAGKLPAEISCMINNVRVTVPVITRKIEPFEPEKL